ncbi:MAG: Glycosyl Hydrolase Family 88 [Syntrophorhabdus sp. PtaU1.Bin002]|nr:MAG: Glycosyl Hydrolase Family 88 [Syntrophorhabdus sp. PtaU1.Bin002]
MNAGNYTIDSSLIRDAVVYLDYWIQENGWTGYDPYDIKGTPIFLWLQQRSTNLTGRVVSRMMLGFEGRYPLLLRRLFGIKKQINAKAMGLFARAYLNLYHTTSEESYKEKALSCLNWLVSNRSKGYNNFCWGYPFDWQSEVFIPKDTPSAVVTSIVGDGFWTAYKVFRHSRYLGMCDDICRFFINSLNIDRQTNKVLCFSYTPLDDFHVHNANLFVAEFLMRVGKEIGNEDYIAFGLRAADYALSEQNADGSIYYWGRLQNHYSPNHIDHYHSGFEIRALYGIWKWTHDTKYKQAVKKYYNFYRSNLLANANGLIVPKMTPGSIYPVNIHSCAEAILCNATLAEEFAEARQLLPALCKWVISRMQSDDGSFIFMVRKKKKGEQFIKIPYIRWGQAWMMLALSIVMSATCSNDEQ